MSETAWTLDLITVAILTVLAAVVALTEAAPDPITWVLGVPFLVVFPGYVVIAIVFPEAPKPAARSPGENRMQSYGRRIRPSATPDWIARFGLALIVSPVVVGVVGILLHWQGAIGLTAVVLELTAIVLVGCGIALGRRWRLPSSVRARPVEHLGQRLRSTTRRNRRHTIALAVALVILAGTVGASLAVQPGTQSYSEAYLLSENGTAAGFETNYTVDDPATLRVGLENHEGQAVTYEVVTVLTAVGTNGSIAERAVLDRVERQLSNGDSAVLTREIVPGFTGTPLRLQVLVYDGGAPDQIDATAADHSLQRWVTVSDPPADG